MKFSKNEKFILLSEKTISGILIHILGFEMIKGGNGVLTNFKFFSMTKIDFGGQNDLTFDLSDKKIFRFQDFPLENGNFAIFVFEGKRNLKFIEFDGGAVLQICEFEEGFDQIPGEVRLEDVDFDGFMGAFIFGENSFSLVQF